MATSRESMEITVISSGNGWLAVDKPAGISVHNAPGEDLCSRSAGFVSAMDNRGDGSGVHPVHRLDKETSGVVLLAFDRETFRFLSRQFETGEVKKEYLAILHGWLGNPEENRWVEWDWPLSRTPGGRENPRGPSPRLPSRTRCRPVEQSPHYTLAEIELLSGRTHQIRRHAKLAGHPVAGDARYGSKRAIEWLKRNRGFDRLALHARAITLRLPGADAPVRLETRGLPFSMRVLLDSDRGNGQ